MGNLNRKKVILQAKAIMESKTLAEAYKKTHNCNDNTANKHCSDMLKNPEVLAQLEKMLDSMKTIDINKANIIKLYQSILIEYQQGLRLENGDFIGGRVKASDVIRVLENLQKLVPDFVDRHVIEEYEKMSEDQLNKSITDKLKRFNSN